MAVTKLSTFWAFNEQKLYYLLAPFFRSYGWQWREKGVLQNILKCADPNKVLRGTPLYTCILCDSVYAEVDHLYEHAVANHALGRSSDQEGSGDSNLDEKYVCAICGVCGFMDANRLAIHVRNHKCANCKMVTKRNEKITFEFGDINNVQLFVGFHVDC